MSEWNGQVQPHVNPWLEKDDYSIAIKNVMDLNFFVPLQIDIALIMKPLNVENISGINLRQVLWHSNMKD